MANERDAVLALWRFGLGARSGDLAAIGGDPRGLLRQEIVEAYVPMPEGPELRSSAELFAELVAFNAAVKAEREAAPATPQATPPIASPDATSATGMMSAPSNDMSRPQAPPRPNLPQQVLLAEVEARFSGTIHQPMIGFGERLAMFWANHFCVAVGKSGPVHIMAGAFEREAIRPHVYGKFEDMLIAVESHPAMLFYLDNNQSIGPNSPANRNGHRGLNENLARETMELHSLGVDGGYTQADVTALSRVLTGWMITRGDNSQGPAGQFYFNARAHEPGDQRVMGRTYRDAGAEQGYAVLRDLARHPATARHLSFKLARYFVSDQPSAELVSRITSTFIRTGGDLREVYLALVDSEEAWTHPAGKMRAPLDYTVAILRATGLHPKPQQVLAVLKAMGQPFWNPSGPNGFSDTSDGWASAEGLAARLDAASFFAHQMTGAEDPRAFFRDRFGATGSQATFEAISRAETRPQGLSIAFLSPEFLRR